MLSLVENLLLITLVFSLMIGIGCSLDLAKMNIYKKQKKAFITGLTLQYISMPLIAVLLINLFKIEGVVSYAILLIACCPGGTTSNMFTYLAKGNIELSIFITFITTLFSSFVTPLLLNFYGKNFIESGPISIPLKNIFISLLFILIPIFVGLGIKKKSHSLSIKLKDYTSKIGYLSMVIMIFIWFPKVFSMLRNYSKDIFFTVALLSFLGITFGLICSKLLRLSAQDSRALGFETGIQNAPLAFTIIMLSFPRDLSLQISWVPLLYGALSVGNSIFYVLILSCVKTSSYKE